MVLEMSKRFYELSIRLGKIGESLDNVVAEEIAEINIQMLQVYEECINGS